MCSLLLPAWRQSSDVHLSLPASTVGTERQEQAPCVYISESETSAGLISLHTGLLKESQVPSARICGKGENKTITI